MKNIEEVLEIAKIKERIVKNAKTIVGKNKILELKPSNEFSVVDKNLSLVKEMNDVYYKYGELPIASELDMYEVILRIKKGNLLDEITLNLIKNDIYTTVDLIKFSLKIDIDLKYLNNMFVSLSANELLYNKISSAISNDNIIKDSASKELYDIRRRIASNDKNIHNLLNKMLGQYKDKLAGENYVIRNGRFAIPVNSSYKASVDGIVQDISDSGQTTFIEPKAVLELENEKQILLIKEKEEEKKILKELTDLVYQNANQLINNNEIIGDLDFIMSKVKFAIEAHANVPKLIKDRRFKLLEARHPLIDYNVCIPNDFILGNDKKLMIISGPNAGGKTIALKTVAVCAYMIKMGLPITASADSEICLFNNIFLDIGDSQSIESNLSTFSAHISNISVYFQYLTSNDLVVIDELCNGTDPKEGEALAVAIVKYLLKTNVLAMVTSHYELLKKYGFTNPNILNASFLFNEKTVTPTFKILLGVSGKSYGLLISKKYGLPDEIIRNAKVIYDKSFENENDKKIAVIGEKERYLLQKEEKLKQRQDSLAKMREELNLKDKQLKDMEAKLKNAKIDKFDTFLTDKYNEINNIYSTFLKDKDIKKAEEKLKNINVKKKKNENIELNDYVEIKFLGIKGRITRIQGTKVTITSQDGLTFNSSRDQCEKIDAPKETLKSTINVDKYIMGQKQVSSKLNLVGYHIDDGLIALDKYLDDCVLRGLKEVKIIHGYGSGKLKAAIHDFLKKKANVKSFRIGNELDGGSGATIVTLK